MSQDDTRSHGPDQQSSHIREARAQFEAAQGRQHRLGGWPAPGSLPRVSLPGYTLVRELHRGGQGVVYLAVQRSTDRQVAIKILYRGPLAALPASSLARFEREVGALSLLKHPNIVTIHDCGRDQEHVYLVMDYVQGRPLDAWAAEARPSTGDVLELFARICDGVNAAHLRGVIHRDLKPGNILVDERGEPHLLDFGLAKLVGDAAPDVTTAPAMTATGQFVGSLPWASPEQAEGRSEDLDVRTDVYSLGVVLYQVLTGRFPYPVSGRQSDVVRHIVHTDPARPSSTDRRVDRELETILLKCLAKEPERRYQSAGELARDLRRYLAGQPIEARRDSLAYVMSKQLARYRAAAGAAAAILVVVVFALAVSLTLWRRAETQRQIAQRSATAALESAARADREAEQARAVMAFLREVLTSVEPENRGADVRLIEVLADASAAATERLGAHPGQEAQVRDLLGQVYDKLSMWSEAQTEFGRGAALYRRVTADDPRGLELLLRQAGALLNVGQTESAGRVLADVAPNLERVFGPDDPRTLESRRLEAIVQLFRGRASEAGRSLLALREHPRLAEEEETQIRILGGLVAVETHLSSVHDPAVQRMHLSRAEALGREWIERSARLHGTDAPATLMAQVRWADVASMLGDYEAAVATCRGILDGFDERLGECHQVRTIAMYILAEALAVLGEEHEPADLHLRRIRCLRQQMAPDGHIFMAAASDALRYLERGGRGPEGEALARELSGALRKFGGGHGDMGFTAELYVATFVSMQGRLDEAEALFAPLLRRAGELTDGRSRARAHARYGGHLMRRGRFEDAERELQAAGASLQDLRRGTWDSHPDDVIGGFIALYEGWGKPDRAAEYRRLRDESRIR